MPRSSFARERITALRFPLVSRRGIQERDYTAATPQRIPIENCWVEPLTSIESEGGRATVFTGYRVDAPPNIDVRSDDLIEYRGSRWEIEGDPLHVPSPTGDLDSTLLVLQQWKG